MTEVKILAETLDRAKHLLSLVNQRNITNDERRDHIAKALVEAEKRGAGAEREECAKVANDAASEIMTLRFGFFTDYCGTMSASDVKKSLRDFAHSIAKHIRKRSEEI